jgi:predicted metal-dependent peptidase
MTTLAPSSVVNNTKYTDMTPLTDAQKAVQHKRIIKARTALVLEHPFFGNIALNLPFFFDDKIPTAATNGKRIKYNPRFVESLCEEEVKFLVAHECGHPMLEHNFRRGERSPRRWNQAGDYVINQLLTNEGIGKMPQGGLLNDALYQAGNGVTDAIYNLLPEDQGGDEGGDPLDDCEDGDGNPADQAQQSAEWKVKVAQAAQAAKMMGKMSAELERFVGNVLNPKVDWRDVMQRFLVKCKSDDRSFARPNRRFLSQGLYLPTSSGETLGEVLFAVDCSGSIGQAEIDQFAAEVRMVKEDLVPTKIHVVYFDSEVSHYESYEPNDSLNIRPHGGGGTDFAPVFKYMVDHGIEPVACVFLTDLCCDSFGEQPSCPVLWVSTQADQAPFGEVVMM